MSSTQAATSSPLSNVFDKLLLKNAIDDTAKKNITKISLTKLDCSFDTVAKLETLPLNNIVRRMMKENKADIALVYAIRDPSCGSCREHGLGLSEFAHGDRKVCLIGTVKATVRHYEQILVFYQDYFQRNAIYLDENSEIFKSLGSRKLSFAILMFGFLSSVNRFRRKKIISSHKKPTETSIMGGLLIFDKEGELCFALETRDFQELDSSVLTAAVAETRRIYNLKKAAATASGVAPL